MDASDSLRALVVKCVLLFLLLHVTLLALADEPLNAYSKWAEVLTHLFALPAIVRGKLTRSKYLWPPWSVSCTIRCATSLT